MGEQGQQATSVIPQPEELTLIIDGIIRERLAIAVQQDQRKLKLEQERQALKQKKREQFVQFLSHISKHSKLWLFWVVSAAVFGGCGVFAGINFLPRGVVCQSSDSPCYWLRVWGQKTAIDQMPSATGDDERQDN